MSQGDLADFPPFDLGADRVLYRVHRSIYPAVWFSTSGDGRFDLTSRPPTGTLYCSPTPEGAFVEVFGRLGVVTQDVVDERLISQIPLETSLRLADLTDASIVGRYGISGDISASPPAGYATSQEWAERFYDAGFDGIHYVARHDPSFSERSVAIFGSEGQAEKLASPDSYLIDRDLIDDCHRRFGIEVLPTATL